MADLLFEILTEEMPAGVQEWAAKDLSKIIRQFLAADLHPGEGVETSRYDPISFATPRRLTLLFNGLPVQTQERVEERKGPRVGAPEQAVQGFVRSAGLTSIDEAEIRDGVYFAVKRIPGVLMAEKLPGLLISAMQNLSWPKSMRWRDGRFAWVRPIRNLLGIFDGETLKGGLHLGRSGGESPREPGYALHGDGPEDGNFLPFTNVTHGHRFLRPEAVGVHSIAEYQKHLAEAYVILDRDQRKTMITDGITALAAAKGLSLIPDDRLLDEVAGLVEYPTPLIGTIDAPFMELPREVLTTSMRTHQKYFAIQDSAGALAPHFVVVANMIPSDGGAAIIAGNERVLRARLSDARFFWEQDLKTPLEDFARKLEDRVFHAKLGTVADKAWRLGELAKFVAELLGNIDPELARKAASLAKADLSSGMVGEFPELQGLMGSYYATAQGHGDAVPLAIREHYQPLGPSDAVPTAPLSIAVALADKIDTLAGFFAIDEKPTGSKDPFALRRAALGVLRIILENGLDLPLRPVLTAAVDRVQDRGGKLEHYDATKTSDEILEFFTDRLRVYWRDQEIRADVIRAVTTGVTDDDLLRYDRRIRTIDGFIRSDIGVNLLAGFKRASNILRIEKQKGDNEFDAAPDPSLLVEPAERTLASALAPAAAAVDAALASGTFEKAIEALGGLRAAVDAFFTDVTVNAEDAALRENRLRLLNQLRNIFLRVADFSVIEG